MKILQINTTVNWGSTGKIAEEIGKIAIKMGWQSWIAYGRGNPTSNSNLIRIGNDFDMYSHGLQTRLFDNHGLSSKAVTRKLISRIKGISPDIIHLHNIHGYYINYRILFEYLKIWKGPVVWTLHDCWPFTGHCAYYDYVKCNKWQTACSKCTQSKSYPSSIWTDRSLHNFKDKKDSFSNCQNLTLVPVSNWLSKELSKSFLSNYPITTIHNGINLNIFKPIHIPSNHNDKLILGVASVWDKRKGLEEFIKLYSVLPKDYKICLVGLSKKQISSLPQGIIGLQRTENIGQLVSLYNSANVFVNPTLEDNFPTTNLESLACGTPVITYNTGGSPEAIDTATGFTVEPQNIRQLAEKIIYICENYPFSTDACRDRASKLYNQDITFKQYINLYNSILTNHV